ncbi:MAG: hypothetical protein U0Q11_16995 [Vicinamibacterales bacterium]
MALIRRCVGLLLLLVVSARASAQSATSPSTGGGSGSASTVNGVAINGPAPPVAPDTLARDGQGHVTLRATRITAPVKIDGKLDDEPYRLVQPMGGFAQTEPRRGEPRPPNEPRCGCSMTTGIYVRAKCYDSSSEEQWVANEMRRDSMNVVRNENFAIYHYDTFYDRRNAFLFELSPIGGIYDAYVTNERAPGNTDYNPVWDRRGGRFEHGWTVE